jgi:hypothetical protein
MGSSLQKQKIPSTPRFRNKSRYIYPRSFISKGTSVRTSAADNKEPQALVRREAKETSKQMLLLYYLITICS